MTPDRGLARRVAAELTRWGIGIDDSAGRKLSSHAAGHVPGPARARRGRRFSAGRAALAAEASAGGRRRVAGAVPPQRAQAGAPASARPPARPRIGGNRSAVDGRIREGPRAIGSRSFARILEPSPRRWRRRDAALPDLVRAHAKSRRGVLPQRMREKGAAALWRGEAGEAAANLIGELIRDGDGIALADGRHYAELFFDLAETRAVRLPYNRQKRLAILGPLEARLLDFDLVVLGGLNEGTWPRDAATDPWLSRPMRREARPGPAGTAHRPRRA